MPHDIATSNGRAAMAYFGEKPWHGLGKRLDRPATSEEAIVAAGLDYQVDLKPLVTVDGTDVPIRKAVVRSDNGEVLGVVGNSYAPVQNREGFAFLDSVVSDGQLAYHTAGALGRGERVWMLAKLPGSIRVKNSEDVTEKYLLLSNAHDGTAALRVFFTPIRVVCANTLSVAHQRGRGSGISILHKGDLSAKVYEARKVLGLAAQFYDDVQIGVNRLAEYYPSERQLDDFFKGLFPDPDEGSRTRVEKVRSKLWDLFASGKGQDIPEVRNTAWAALNAVTEYVDHHRPTRAKSEQERASKRLHSQWFGSGARLKSQAWDSAMFMASC